MSFCGGWTDYKKINLFGPHHRAQASLCLSVFGALPWLRTAPVTGSLSRETPATQPREKMVYFTQYVSPNSNTLAHTIVTCQSKSHSPAAYLCSSLTSARGHRTPSYLFITPKHAISMQSQPALPTGTRAPGHACLPHIT